METSTCHKIPANQLLSHLRNTYKQTTSSVSAMTDAKVAVKVAVKAITISLIWWCGQCKFDTIV